MSMSTHSPEPWTTNDKELLVLAAKANGVPAYWSVDGTLQQRPIFVVAAGGRMGTMPYEQEWNPLKNDVDAFRLAVALRIHVSPTPAFIEARYFDGAAWQCFREHGNSMPSVCRAIVLAAAALGRAMA